MTPEKWREIEDCFDRVADLSADARNRVLADVDADVRDEVQSLLACHDRPANFLQDAIGDQAKIIVQGSTENWIGKRLGPWRINGVLGQGGMGTVFDAGRDDEHYKQRVAIKLVKLEMDSELGRSRFVRERQILAALHHPFIAKLLDGGATADGLPYLVMEYIDGRPLLDYAREHDLSVEQRVRLFRDILSAVAFAHQKLIVHRDLKPSNILITPEGTPRLLDFGIARLLEQDLDNAMPAETLMVSGLMTPGYASPEQVRGEPVAPASDIYSLGTILFELLTDTPAHVLSAQSAAEIVRVVCHDGVPKPSDVAPERVSRKLRGDLDVIVLTALQKDPARRYTSAEAMAEDLLRYQEGLPIRARPDSFVYRAGKFARRHAGAVIAGLLAVVALTAGIVTTAIQARRAERRFQEVRQLANRFLFDFENQLHDVPGAIKAREMVVATSLEYLNRLAADAGNDRPLLDEIAQAYEKTGDIQGWPPAANLGHFRDALATYGKALALYQRVLDAQPNDPRLQLRMSRCYSHMSETYVQANQLQEAAEAARKANEFATAALKRLPADADARMLQSGALRVRALALSRQGNAGAAIPLFQEAVQLLESQVRDGLPRANFVLSTVLGNLARAQERRGQLEEALRSIDRGIALQEKILAENPGSATGRRNLHVSTQSKGGLLGANDRPNLGRPKEALAVYERSYEIAKRIFDADPNDALARTDYALSMGKIADLVARTDPRRSLDLSEKAITALRQNASADDLVRLEAAYLISTSEPLHALGDRNATQDHLLRARVILKRLLAATPQAVDLQSDLADIEAGLADLERERRAWKEATSAYQRSLELVEPLARAHPDNLRMQWQLAGVYDRMADNATAAASREEAVHWRSESLKLWQGWNRRTPDSAYGQAREREAKSRLN